MRRVHVSTGSVGGIARTGFASMVVALLSFAHVDAARAQAHAAPGHAAGHAHAPGPGDSGSHGGLHAAGDHHEAYNPWEFAATCINFLLWLGILVWLLRRPTTEFLKQRRLSVEEGIAKAERFRQEAERKHQKYTDKLAALDQELAQMRAEMIKAGEAERDRLIAEAEERAARIRRETEFLIEQQAKQLRIDLAREAVDAAIEAAARLLAEQMTPGDHERLARNYTKELGSAEGSEEAHP